MTQGILEFEDITASRHKMNPASVAANPAAANKRRMRQRVLEIVKTQGHTHSKRIARILDQPLHYISGRISELLAAGLIEVDEGMPYTEGCRMLRIKR